MKLVKYLLLMSAALVALSQSARAVVTFTNTPAAVSNTFTGTITLLIGGLTNGETVVVQKYLDANTNGVIDGRDILVQQFNLTDGDELCHRRRDQLQCARRFECHDRRHHRDIDFSKRRFHSEHRRQIFV